MMLKDNNFISAVVYLHNDGARAVEFCRTVAAELDATLNNMSWSSWTTPAPTTRSNSCAPGAGNRTPR